MMHTLTKKAVLAMRASKRGVAALALLLAAACLVAPLPAYAQCEPMGTALGAASPVIAAHAAAISTAFVVGAVPKAYEVQLGAASTVINSGIDAMEASMFNKMQSIWGLWDEALRDMSKQLSAVLVDQSRQMSSMYDSSGITDTGRDVQRAEIEAKKAYEPSEQDCRFDTMATYGTAVSRVGKAVENKTAEDLNKLGSNAAGTPAAKGPASMQQARWQDYATLFCDGVSNAGNPGCATGNPHANAHVLPSKTIFGKETMDMSTEGHRKAVTTLIQNIVNYEVPAVINVQALNSPQGQEKRLENRSYVAQMDAVMALPSMIVAERMPGPPAPEIKQLRDRMQVADASATPSEREIRQAMLEQLWDPEFFLSLGTKSAPAISRAELNVQIYNLMLLYKTIERMERISTVYAVQTANLLDKTDGSRQNASSARPVR